MREYNPTKRLQDPLYLTINAEILKSGAIATKNSSAIIYACVDLRTSLELIEFIILLGSVSEELRPEIVELGKTKNGIDKANKKIKSLKEKFQLFYQALCETANISGRRFDYKKSDDLQFALSKYLHSFIRHPLEINFESIFMQDALILIDETIKFILDYISYETGEMKIQCINVNKIPSEDKLLLEEWKSSTRMTYEQLKERLSENLKNRIS
jgi:hypothetical protein